MYVTGAWVYFLASNLSEAATFVELRCVQLYMEQFEEHSYKKHIKIIRKKTLIRHSRCITQSVVQQRLGSRLDCTIPLQEGL